MAVTFGILGIKIQKAIISEEELYTRFDLVPTELLFNKKLSLNKRKELVEENLSHIINYSKVINDKDHYLWQRIAEETQAYITFINEDARERWFERIIEEIENYGDKEHFHLNLLKMFEKLHWIRIISESNREFEIKIPAERDKDNIEMLIGKLSEHGQLKESKGFFTFNQ